jgi:hypothetical protein
LFSLLLYSIIDLSKKIIRAYYWYICILPICFLFTTGDKSTLHRLFVLFYWFRPSLYLFLFVCLYILIIWIKKKETINRIYWYFFKSIATIYLCPYLFHLDSGISLSLSSLIHNVLVLVMVTGRACRVQDFWTRTRTWTRTR